MAPVEAVLLLATAHVAAFVPTCVPGATRRASVCTRMRGGPGPGPPAACRGLAGSGSSCGPMTAQELRSADVPRTRRGAVSLAVQIGVAAASILPYIRGTPAAARDFLGASGDEVRPPDASVELLRRQLSGDIADLKQGALGTKVGFGAVPNKQVLYPAWMIGTWQGVHHCAHRFPSPLPAHRFHSHCPQCSHVHAPVCQLSLGPASARAAGRGFTARQVGKDRRHDELPTALQRSTIITSCCLLLECSAARLPSVQNISGYRANALVSHALQQMLGHLLHISEPVQQMATHVQPSASRSRCP